jgi:hypothetical protein
VVRRFSLEINLALEGVRRREGVLLQGHEDGAQGVGELLLAAIQGRIRGLDFGGETREPRLGGLRPSFGDGIASARQ